MSHSSQNMLAMLYASYNPGDPEELGFQDQFLDMNAYCLRRGFEVAEMVSDPEAPQPGRIRAGFEKVLARAEAEGVGHVVIFDIGRITCDSRSALAFLKHAAARSAVKVHILSWEMETGSPEIAKALKAAEDILEMQSASPKALPSSLRMRMASAERELLRVKPLWRKIFSLLQDERYAGSLITALTELKDTLDLGERELQAVHGAYDHLVLFQALGFRIKGERTDNTRLVSDALSRNWPLIKTRLRGELHEIVDGFETGAFF